MRLGGRVPFLAATLVVLAVLATGLSGNLPMPQDYETARQANPYSRHALLMLSGGLAAAWIVLVVPWTALLSLRLRARQRPRLLAVVPAVLGAIAIGGIAAGGYALGGPRFGYQAENPVPFVTWSNSDFIILDSVILATAATGAVALIFALALTFEALRPDARRIDQIFS